MTRLVVPTSRSRAPVETSRSGIRKPSPISTSSPRASTISRPAASAVAASTSAAAPLLTTCTASASGTAAASAAERAAPAPARAGRWPGRARRRWCRRRRAPRPAAATDSGARPRLVCSSTPVALSTGRSVAGAAGRSASTAGDHRVRLQRAGPDPLLGRGDRLRTSAAAEPADRPVQARVAEHGVGARHPPARVRLRFRGGHAVTVRPRAGRRPGRSATVRPVGPAPAADGLRPGART